MAWCRQATSHYLSQCWPRSMSPNGVTRPQWVNPYVLDLILFQEIQYKNLIAFSIISSWWVWHRQFNSLVPGTCKVIFKYVIFKHIVVNDIQNSFCETALSYMPIGLTDDKSTLVQPQVMAWCCQATSHCLNQFDRDLWCHMVSLGRNELSCKTLPCILQEVCDKGPNNAGSIQSLQKISKTCESLWGNKDQVIQ